MKSLSTFGAILAIAATCFLVFLCIPPGWIMATTATTTATPTALGWFWGSVLFFATFFIASIFSQRDEFFWSILSFAAGSFLIFWMSAGVWTWLISLHWYQWLLYPGIFLVLGGLWATYRWVMHSRKGVQRVKDAKKGRLQPYQTRNASAQELAKLELDLEEQFVATKERIRESFRLMNNKTKFYGWIILWPGDVFYYLFTELLQDVIDMMFDRLKAFWGRLEFKIWGNTEKEIAAEREAIDQKKNEHAQSELAALDENDGQISEDKKDSDKNKKNRR